MLLLQKIKIIARYEDIIRENELFKILHFCTPKGLYIKDVITMGGSGGH